MTDNTNTPPIEINNVDNFLTPEQLKVAVQEAQNKGEAVVFTNGCFDILHAGHVNYLKEAKALGARLIVAVNSDDSVARLKGEDRPILPLEDRLTILSGLKSVDWVTYYEEDTPESVLSTVKPDILVKGGDYTADTVVGREFVESYGGKVLVMELTNDRSTSSIINKINPLK